MFLDSVVFVYIWKRFVGVLGLVGVVGYFCRGDWVKVWIFVILRGVGTCSFVIV